MFMDDFIDLKNNLEKRVQNFKEDYRQGNSGGEWFNHYQNEMSAEYVAYMANRDPNQTFADEIER